MGPFKGWKVLHLVMENGPSYCSNEDKGKFGPEHQASSPLTLPVLQPGTCWASLDALGFLFTSCAKCGNLGFPLETYLRCALVSPS